MHSRTITNKTKYTKKFFEDVVPVKLTEARRVKQHVESWGILTDYYLESVKTTWFKGGVETTAVLKVGDKSGQSVCIVKGPQVGLLFGLSEQEWTAVENTCGTRQQLFYRYFKCGLSQHFPLEQRLFYNFCLTNQKTDVLVAVYRRGVNTRKKDKDDAFLELMELRKCESYMLDLYISQLRRNVNELDSRTNQVN